MKTQCANCKKILERKPCRALKGRCYCNAKCQLEYEYKTGIRDKMAVTAAAHAMTKKLGAPWLHKQPPWNAGKIGQCPQLAKVGEKNPMYGKFGKAHHGYKTGASTRRKRDWSRSIYQNWRKAVFAKDDYTCQECGDDKGGNLHAHHIKPWATFEEGRYDITNGITLCELCHIDTHKTHGKLHPMCRCTLVPILIGE